VGFADLLLDLHPRLGWDGAQVTVDSTTDLDVAADPGLVITPSAFLPRPALWLGSADQVMVGYPARGRGQVWSTPRAVSGETPVLGLRKTALLADLATPRSTAELATRHQLSPPAVSYHLTRLHQLGLLTRRQAGHAALYQRTARAAALLTALDASASA
jgi:DNA-binding CsgD family transcriptional regulator